MLFDRNYLIHFLFAVTDETSYIFSIVNFPTKTAHTTALTYQLWITGYTEGVQSHDIPAVDHWLH